MPPVPVSESRSLTETLVIEAPVGIDLRAALTTTESPADPLVAPIPDCKNKTLAEPEVVLSEVAVVAVPLTEVKVTVVPIAAFAGTELRTPDPKQQQQQARCA